MYLLAAGLVLGGGLSSVSGCIEPVPDHCNHNGGDEYCRGKYPDQPIYCSDGTCVDAPADGCVTEIPTDCWQCNGVDGDNSNCDDVAGDGDGDPTGDGDGDMTGDGDGDPTGDGDGDGETGPMCVDSSECGGDTPLCDGGECVGCGDASDVSCASEFSDTTPVCDEAVGQCVVCTVDDVSECGGNTPACGGGVCVACDEHDQCPDSACNMATGACMDVERVWWVNDAAAPGGTGTMQLPFDQISDALDMVGDGQEGVVILATAESHQEQVLIGTGQTVALLGDGDGADLQNGGTVIFLDSGATLFASRINVVLGSTGVSCMSGGTLYFDDGRVSGLSGWGASLTNCDAAFRRTVVTGNMMGGIQLLGGGALALTNSTVGGQITDVVAVAAGTGTVTIIYTTIAATLASALTCEGDGTNVTVRNSLVVNRNAIGEVAGCDSATISNSALESAFGSNLVLNDMDPDWFTDWGTGDLTLSADLAPAELATAARWQTGDPATDINGTLRPTTDDAPDYAGADIPE